MEGWWWGKEEPPSITFFLFKFRISPSSKKYQHGLNGRLNPLSVAGSFVVMSNVYRRVGGRCGEGRERGRLTSLPHIEWDWLVLRWISGLSISHRPPNSRVVHTLHVCTGTRVVGKKKLKF